MGMLYDTKCCGYRNGCVDCKGFAKQKYHPLGRNLGGIQFVHGGVGRNVVQNLANLGLNTTFLSSVDGTGIGQEVFLGLLDAGSMLITWPKQSLRAWVSGWQF